MPVRTWRRGVALAAILVLVPTAGGSVALAASSSNAQKQAQVKSQISNLKGDLNEVSSDYADLLGKLDDINNRKADLDSQTAALQQQIDAVQADLNAAQGVLDQQQAKTDQAEAQLKDAQTQLAISNKKMQDQAVDAYIGREPTTNLANFLLRSNDMRQLTAASEYMHQVVQDRRDVVEEHRELEGQAHDLAKQVEAARAAAQVSRDKISGQQQQLLGQKSQLDQLKAQAQVDADQQAQLLGQVAAKKAGIQQQINDLQAQSDSIGGLLRSSSGGSGAGIPPGKGVFVNPVPGAPLTSPFGMRLDPVVGVYQLHAGQDFGVSTGTAIHAGADGTVATAGWVTGYGNYTCINHGGGMATCYAHQSQILVSVGQHVSRNQVIGLSGSTGYATGPHLHWEVRINGNPVNPIPYL